MYIVIIFYWYTVITSNCFNVSSIFVWSVACYPDSFTCTLCMWFCAVPNAAIHTTVNNILIKTLWNSSVTALCGPLCPSISIQASWQQHSGAASNPMTLVHVGCANCRLSIGQENILAIEQITKCAQVRNSLSNHLSMPPIRCFYELTLCTLQIVFTITITIW